MRYLLFLLLSFAICLVACNTDGKKNTSTEKKTVETQKAKPAPAKKAKPSNVTIGKDGYTYITTNTGKKVHKAQQGITIVNHDGWTESQMTFQIDYCMQMMAKLEDVDSNKFCVCFLEKVQYFYKPIHARDAWDDQKDWNTDCYVDAQI